MERILKIDDAKIITQDGVRIERFIFNNDKIVKVNADTNEVITKNVPKEYLQLISVYSSTVKIQENETEKKAPKKDISSKIKQIQSGSGAGLGVFLGFLLNFTIIGPIIAGFFSFSFLENMSDEEYLKNTDAKDINFKKGFYGTAVFGLLVAIACCDQWKTDMISVLNKGPNRQSKNKHICFKIWFYIIYGLSLIEFIVRITPKLLNIF